MFIYVKLGRDFSKKIAEKFFNERVKKFTLS